MPIRPVFPDLPAVRLEMLEDLSPPGQGFLRLSRRRYRARHGDGSVSAPFVYDEVERHALDAVVVVPHFLAPAVDAGKPGAPELERYVYLRSAVRPPVEMRDAARSAVPEPEVRALWEAPAGLVEPDEESPEGIVRCAQRELAEETGFEMPTSAFQELGPSTFPCPGVIAERHYFFHVEVEPERRGEPSLDGSALEAAGQVIAVPLREALQACREGRLADAKTELALRRLAEVPLP